MYEVTSISEIKEERPFAWNVLFQINGESMSYATDIIFAAKRGVWVVNSYITHNLSSLMEVKHCVFCSENKIACPVLCNHHEEVMKSMIENKYFQQYIEEEIPALVAPDFPTELQVEARKYIWDEILYENFTAKLLMKKP